MALLKLLIASCAVTAMACGSDETKRSSSSGSSTGGSAGTTSTGGNGNGGSGGAGGAAGSGGNAANPVVEIDTDMGLIVVELDAQNMPATTANFLAYVDAGFYSGTIIHRVIPDFVIQGGGFTAGLTPKPTNAPIALETSPQVLHDYGAISMARTNAPDSATSQFFLVNGQAGAHNLDGSYAAFGHMTEGAAVLDAISAVPTETQGNFMDVPVTDVVVNSITRQ